VSDTPRESCGSDGKDQLRAIRPSSQPCGTDLLSFPDALHPVQEGERELVYGSRLESDVRGVPKRPNSRHIGVGLVSDVFGEEMLEPDNARLRMLP